MDRRDDLQGRIPISMPYDLQHHHGRPSSRTSLSLSHAVLFCEKDRMRVNTVLSNDLDLVDRVSHDIFYWSAPVTLSNEPFFGIVFGPCHSTS